MYERKIIVNLRLKFVERINFVELTSEVPKRSDFHPVRKAVSPEPE